MTISTKALLFAYRSTIELAYLRLLDAGQPAQAQAIKDDLRRIDRQVKAISPVLPLRDPAFAISGTHPQTQGPAFVRVSGPPPGPGGRAPAPDAPHAAPTPLPDPIRPSTARPHLLRKPEDGQRPPWPRPVCFPSPVFVSPRTIHALLAAAAHADSPAMAAMIARRAITSRAGHLTLGR